MKTFVETFAKKTGIQEPKDWLQVSHISIKNEPGGSGLLSWYKYSLHRILEDCYPDVDWTALKETQKLEKPAPPEPVDLSEARKVFDKIGKELGVTEMKDWYKIPVARIRERTNLIRRFQNKLECFKASTFLCITEDVILIVAFSIS